MNMGFENDRLSCPAIMQCKGNVLVSILYSFFDAGDADSKGSTRKRELFQACATLKVPMQQVKVVDHSDLQDGFGKVWNHMLVANLVKEEIDNYNIDMMITFDNYGVSGHCNHRDVHYGVCKLLYDIPRREIEAWGLVRTNILRKYSGPIDVWLSMFGAIYASFK
ncbi:hypothetical protein K1719_018090 [Acacia pycnantha]|nr:hypothetical protein K1719_018090 [Acacia pycnantha]